MSRQDDIWADLEKLAGGGHPPSMMDIEEPGKFEPVQFIPLKNGGIGLVRTKDIIEHNPHAPVGKRDRRYHPPKQEPPPGTPVIGLLLASFVLSVLAAGVASFLRGGVPEIGVLILGIACATTIFFVIFLALTTKTGGGGSQ